MKEGSLPPQEPARNLEAEADKKPPAIMDKMQEMLKMADRSMEAKKTTKEQNRKKKEASKKEEDKKQAKGSRSIKEMLNLWSKKAEGTPGTSPGNILPSNKKSGRNMEERSSQVTRKEANVEVKETVEGSKPPGNNSPKVEGKIWKNELVRNSAEKEGGGRKMEKLEEVEKDRAYRNTGAVKVM